MPGTRLFLSCYIYSMLKNIVFEDKKRKKFFREVTTPLGCAPIGGGWGTLVKYTYIFIWFTQYKPNKILHFCFTNVNLC